MKPIVKKERFYIRLTEEEKTALQREAKNKGKTMADILRDLIRQLPSQN